MNIAFVLTQSLKSPSGLGRYWPLAKELARLGHQVDVIALHHNWRLIAHKSVVLDKVRVFYVGQMHVKKSASQKTYFNPVQLLWVTFIATVQFTRVLFQTKPDVVHIGKPHPMNSIAAIIYGFLTNTPLYLDVDDFEAESNRFDGKWQRKIIQWFENFVPCQVKAITVNTYFSKNRLLQLGCMAERIILVPNGVDRERFWGDFTDEVSNLKEKYHLSGKQILVYVGSISLVSHDVDLLIEAFSRVVNVLSDVVLLLVGGGEDLPLIQQQISKMDLEEKIIMTGRISPEIIPAYYQLADLSVDPVKDNDVAKSRSPLKIFESLACGVPVVTGDVGDRRAILQSGEYGFLTERDDVETLASTLVSALSDVDHLQGIRNKILAKTDSINLFWDTLVQDFITIYGVL